jgi:hypothetical protein
VSKLVKYALFTGIALYVVSRIKQGGLLSGLGEDANLDISAKEDASVALMNLISLEEHLVFSFAKTQNSKYLDLLSQVRKIRQALMEKCIKNFEPGAEIWCMGKHLLAASMRIMETGSKYLQNGDTTQAGDCFSRAKVLRDLFMKLTCNCSEVGPCYGG